MRSTSKDIGPITYYRLKDKKKEKNVISLFLKGRDEVAFGWEWGTEDYAGSPSVVVRFLGLNWLKYEKLLKGYQMWVLGFWWNK